MKAFPMVFVACFPAGALRPGCSSQQHIVFLSPLCPVDLVTKDKRLTYRSLRGDWQAWFRELPRGVLDSLAPEQVMQCHSEEQCVELVKQLPATQAALLDWAVNLMADVAQEEQINKMNARNIAMVFAPNMTQV